MSLALIAREATVAIGGRTVLGPISLSLGPGEALVVVGPNGAGKSTLLSMLAGVRAPSSGALTLSGSPLSSLASRARARSIAYLPQATRFDFPYSVADAVAMGRFPHGDERAAGGKDAIDAAIDAMKLGVLRERRVDTLSGGEQQRVALARTFAIGAPIWLLDEPMAGLDLAVTVHVRDKIAAHTERGGTVVLTHHALSEVPDLGRRLVLVEKGRVTADGTPDAVLTPARIESAFGVAAGRQESWRFDSLRR